MPKRLFDIFFSALSLVPLAPFFVIIAFAIKISTSGPIFFRQIRVGRHGKLFRIFKFRTMVIDAEKYGPQVSSGDDSRITPIGSFLRKYKIDELPQLLNVIIGDMSLVGPRPEVPKYVAVYPADYAMILRVRPGITDFASIEFRDESTLLTSVDNPEQIYLHEILPLKIKYYKRYLIEQSMFTDIKIIIMTLVKIVWS
jgi:lipopolysaccharide/colanic/teichoic acid biosynthesis glycosyltransferase